MTLTVAIHTTAWPPHTFICLCPQKIITTAKTTTTKTTTNTSVWPLAEDEKD